MSDARGAPVYRICAAPSHGWNVFEDLSDEPVACFDNKTTALNYAMSLARGSVTWRSLAAGTLSRLSNAGSNRPRG